MARITDLFRRASNLWYYGCGHTPSKDSIADGDIIYSKNNVCIHSSQTTPIAGQESGSDHHPGYLTLRVHECEYDVDEGCNSAESKYTLQLSWVPNTILKRNPKYIETRTPNNSPYRSGRGSNNATPCSVNELRSCQLSRRQSLQSLSSAIGVDDIFDVRPEQITEALNSMIIRLDSESRPSDCKSDDVDSSVAGESQSKTLKIQIPNVTQVSSSCPTIRTTKIPVSELPGRLSNFESSPKLKRSSSAVSTRSATTPPTPTIFYGRQISYENPREIFSVDLRHMKSLKFVFSNGMTEQNEEAKGQLIVTSRENQYKMFHFHCGGLYKLVHILEEWDFLRKDRRQATSESNCRQFYISKSQLNVGECHPEEDFYTLVNEDVYKEFLNEHGQIEDDYSLRKAVFFGGIHHSIRKYVWPFLLHRFDYDSTTDERLKSIVEKKQEYNEINAQREQTMDENEVELKSIQCIIEKDVIRTDRNNPFFAGEINKNIDMMKRILLNYAVYNPLMGYTQGMSDLLSPLLLEIRDESEAFWSFVGLMEKTIFVCSPRDVDIDANLNLLRELIRITLPKFYSHIRCLDDSIELLFAHRWILLCFKREFKEEDSLRIWESCWAHCQTDYFHLFVCLAIIFIYGDEVVDQNMKSDEILFHFSTLTMNMNGTLILRKARGLLYQFRLLPRIPCTLETLCNFCGPGMWDSGHIPAIDCIQNFPLNDIDVPCQCQTLKEMASSSSSSNLSLHENP